MLPVQKTHVQRKLSLLITLSNLSKPYRTSWHGDYTNSPHHNATCFTFVIPSLFPLLILYLQDSPLLTTKHPPAPHLGNIHLTKILLTLRKIANKDTKTTLHHALVPLHNHSIHILKRTIARQMKIPIQNRNPTRPIQKDPLAHDSNPPRFPHGHITLPPLSLHHPKHAERSEQHLQKFLPLIHHANTLDPPRPHLNTIPLPLINKKLTTLRK